MEHLIIGNYYLFSGLKCRLLYAETTLTRESLMSRYRWDKSTEFDCKIMFKSGGVGVVSSYRLTELPEGEE